MANGSNIKTYTASDIERYHKGLLSPKEMHDLEKAALDDPFLADALEGYAVAGINVSADIAELKKRLAEKTEEAKVIPLRKAGTSIPWLRAAAMIIVILGVGFMIYQFGFNNKRGEIAQSTNKYKKEETAKVSIPDTNKINTTTPVSDNGTVSTETNPSANKDNPVAPNRRGEEKLNRGTDIKLDDFDTMTDSMNATANRSKETSAPVVAEKLERDLAGKASGIKTQVSADSISYTDRGVTAKAKQVKVEDKKDNDNSGVIAQNDNYRKNANIAAGSEAKRYDNSNNTQQYNAYNNFRGRVVDQSNNPLPFANITNTQDNVGTYTDAKGYFNLTSPDSVLNVQVRSLGFNVSNQQLNNRAADNKLVLQEDKSLNEVVISNKMPNTTLRQQANNMKVEEPEPADGWDKYDAYLANNLNMPEELKSKQTGGEVEVSFEVNKNGEPINIKVEKSLCGKCDVEAIRLIKDGPKWKRKANKKGRTTVTISF